MGFAAAFALLTTPLLIKESKAIKVNVDTNSRFMAQRALSFTIISIPRVYILCPVKSLRSVKFLSDRTKASCLILQPVTFVNNVVVWEGKIRRVI